MAIDIGNPEERRGDLVAALKTLMQPEWSDVAARADAVQAIYDAITAPPKTIEVAAYTLLPEDFGRVLRFTVACVVTLPSDLPAGWYCVPRRVGAGAVTWVAAAGATKHEYPAGTGIAAQWASVTASVDANAGEAAVWLIEGAIL